MKTNRYDIAIAYLCLISGLIISSVAVWYSVAGLVSIFAAAAIPIIIMGVALEGSKLVATVWLKLNWHRAPLSIKAYLSIAIAILMLITSMGIFGYLSKAHLDQNIVSGDVQAKIAIYDEKIATAKGNIDANRRALKQMDEAVDQVMGRSQDEKGADKAVALRRGQAKERTRLLSEIAAEQKTIAQLSEERAPIAAEVRKVEAEVGPIKYIAKLIYGDDPNANVLEKAVTWVIIIIVLVFDPLAVVLLLASQYSFQWLREQKQEESESKEILETDIDLDDSPDPWMEDLVVQKEESKKPFYSQASAFWPFPAKQKDDDFKFLADEKDLYPEEEKKEIIEEIAEPVDEELEEIENALESEKEAMRSWKHDNPNDSLKRHRKLFEQGIIKKLPWEDYLKPKADFTDNVAAEEAAKWAQEQLEKNQEESKKKDNIVDGASGEGTDSKKMGEVGYSQNAEQSESTLWKRIQDAKK